MASATYTVHQCLGRGGFGEVYLATRRTREGLEKKVAIKVLRDDLSNADSALARMRDEARMLAILDHPVVVSVVELTRLDGRVTLVTEYIEGTDLARFCSPSNLAPARVVCEAAAQIAEALAVADTLPSPDTGKPMHLIHRDLKPENIRLSKHGEVKLLDFGIARSTELMRAARTVTGNVPFTIGYTAPETFVSLTQHPPSDVFALGATLYRLLVGERFYEALKLTEQASLSGSERRFDEFHRYRLARVGHLEPALGDLLARMLAFDPAARPTAREVQLGLEALLERLPGPPIRRWAREAQFSQEGTPDGPLCGRVLTEDETTEAELSVHRHPPAPPPAPKDLVPLRPRWEQGRSDRPPAPPGPESFRPAPVARFPWMAAGLVVVMLAVAGVAVTLSVVFAGLWWAM